MDNVQKISIDIMNNKYSDYIYAKQHDRNRTVEFTITENGKKKELDDTHCTFVMKGKKVVSFKHLVRSGDVYKMSLEPNDTHEAGKLPYQLILSSGEVDIEVDEHGEYHIIWGDDGVIIGTVTGYMLVEQCVVSDDDAATQFDTNILQDLLGAVQEAEGVIDDIEALNQESLGYRNLSESYAKGGTGTREGENTDNAKYYSEQANASSVLSQSYSVGGTNTREGEDKDNAKYYSEQAEHAKDLVIITKKVTLLVTGEGSWNRNTNTITVPCDGITDNEDEQLIVVRPYEQYIEEYLSCNIRCIAQGDGILTFKCDTIPSRNIDVHVNSQMLVIDNEAQSRIIYTNIEPESGEINTDDYWVCDYTESIIIADYPTTFLMPNTWTTYSVPEDFHDFCISQFILFNAPGNRITIYKDRAKIATYVSGMNYESATLVYDDGNGYQLYQAIDSDGSNVRFYANTDIQTQVGEGIVIHAI